MRTFYLWNLILHFFHLYSVPTIDSVNLVSILHTIHSHRTQSCLFYMHINVWCKCIFINAGNVIKWIETFNKTKYTYFVKKERNCTKHTTSFSWLIGFTYEVRLTLTGSSWKIYQVYIVCERVDVFCPSVVGVSVFSFVYGERYTCKRNALQRGPRSLTTRIAFGVCVCERVCAARFIECCWLLVLQSSYLKKSNK